MNETIVQQQVQLALLVILSVILSGRSMTSNHSERHVSILGFGSLLSESSSRLTFPMLKNFRLGRVKNYRRVFAHPASIFFQRGLANFETLEMSSLSAEPCEGATFVCSVFEVPSDCLGVCKENTDGDSLPFSLNNQFREREEEFNIVFVPYEELDDKKEHMQKSGVLCTRSTDEAYLAMWGKHRFEENYGKYGIRTIWGYDANSGLRPCSVYLRHCVLAAKRMGDPCLFSFLDETFLVDRKTTIRSYLEKYPHVMKTLPPEKLRSRYGG